MGYQEAYTDMAELLIAIGVGCAIVYFVVNIALPNVLLGVIGIGRYSRSCSSRDWLRCTLRATGVAAIAFLVLAVLPTILFVRSRHFEDAVDLLVKPTSWGCGWCSAGNGVGGPAC